MGNFVPLTKVSFDQKNNNEFKMIKEYYLQLDLDDQSFYNQVKTTQANKKPPKQGHETPPKNKRVQRFYFMKINFFKFFNGF